MSKINISFYIDKYLKYMENIRSSSTHTLAAYSRDLAQTFPAEKVQKTWSEDELLSACRKAQTSWSHLSLSSRNRKSAALKSFFQWLFSEGITQKNWALQIIAPKVPAQLPHFISVDEVISILKVFTPEQNNSFTQKEYSSQADNFLNNHEELLFFLLYGGGLRISEACQIKWRDLSFATRSLRVIGKGKKERIVVLPEFVIKKMNDHYNRLKKDFQIEALDYVFGKTPLNRRTGYQMIRNLGQKAGLQQGLHPHALRHSFATHLLTGGVSLRILQELLGHESLTATQKYTHLSMDNLARTMDSAHPLGHKIKI